MECKLLAERNKELQENARLAKKNKWETPFPLFDECLQRAFKKANVSQFQALVQPDRTSIVGKATSNITINKVCDAFIEPLMVYHCEWFKQKDKKGNNRKRTATAMVRNISAHAFEDFAVLLGPLLKALSHLVRESDKGKLAAVFANAFLEAHNSIVEGVQEASKHVFALNRLVSC